MVKAINLALQGGGAHGAFTWGVLDRLLSDGRLTIGAISGTSAGAMNAAVMADGLVRGGRDGAREALATFWRAVSELGRYSPIQRTFVDMLIGNWSLDRNPGYLVTDMISRVVSPYQTNPLNLNPLRDLLEDAIDFERVRSCDETLIFVSATNVETGRVTVFDRKALTADMVLASACLPFLFQAVEIDGVPYWDGGYMGNPVLFPLFKAGDTEDVVIVQINPMHRAGTPKTARDILNRVNEITFNGSLMKELRAIEFVARLLDEGCVTPDRYRRLRVHMIGGADELLEMEASSKMNAEWAFLRHLFDIGFNAADRWLATHYDALGERATIDLRGVFQGREGEE